MARKYKRKPIDPNELATRRANDVSAGRLAPEDLDAVLIRDNGLGAVPVTVPTEMPKPAPSGQNFSLQARKPAPAPSMLEAPKTYGRKCPYCGVVITTDDSTAVERVLREHVGLIEGTAARCNQLRREQGLV